MIEQLTLIAVAGGLFALIGLGALMVLIYMSMFMPRDDDSDHDTDGQNRADQRQDYLTRWGDNL